MNVSQNVSLKPYNTFGIDVNAAHFTVFKSVDDVSGLLNSEIFKNNPVLFLGGGSNVLFTNDFDGLVIKNEIKGLEVISETDDEVFIRAGAGEIWQDLVEYSLDLGLGGIENLSLIPGTVGAAPMQNIGAYGVEIKDIFTELAAIDRSNGNTKVFKAEDCHFGYRNSVFKNELRDKFIITSVTLRLSGNPVVNTSYGAISETLQSWGIDQPGPKDVSKAVIQIRRSKLPDPAEIGNAGSFFKNPIISLEQFKELKQRWTGLPGYTDSEHHIKVPAAWLIDTCGWKGKRFGEIGIHQKQALVLVNYGKGSGKEIHDLAMKIKSSVQKTFGIELTPEVNII